MTLPDAITANQVLQKSFIARGYPITAQLMQINIEALKRLLDARRFPQAANWKPLPGETE